jgi:hypothetical protein
MTEEELRLIALKMGGISEAVRKRNLGTGASAADVTRPTEAARTDHVHNLARSRAGAAPPNFASQPSNDEGKLNKLETSFLAWLRSEQLEPIGIQRITFKLAGGLKRGLRYTPDFDAVVNGRWTFFEVKGPMFWDDARKSLVVVAAQFPWLDFYLCRRNPLTKLFTNTHVKP